MSHTEIYIVSGDHKGRDFLKNNLHKMIKM